MANKTYDVIVIGSGPGGYVAAIRCGQLGLKTLCVEKADVGGVCLNWGCIPSKALIAASGFVEKAHKASAMGITVSGVSVDLVKMQEWKNGIVKKLTGGVASLVKGAGGDIVKGTAKLLSNRSVEVTKADGTKESFDAAKGIIVATGAEVIKLPTIPLDGEVVITAKEAVSLTKAEGTMVIIGGGVIGMELGMVYQKLGMKIIVVELLEQLLGTTDTDLVKVVERTFTKAGGEVLLKTKAQKVERVGDKAKVVVEGPDGKTREIMAERVLCSIGFKPSSKDLGLEALGVKLDPRGHIVVDDQFQTNVKGIYAIGDVIGGGYLAHKASKEGEIAAEVIAGHKAARDWRVMPAAIFTEPEIATAGLSEKECAAQGKKVRIGKFPFSVSGRAMAVSQTDGFIKSIIDAETHEVLGVGIVGPEASDLISEAALAIEMCAYAEDVGLTIHPHPTLGEAMMESFKHALGEAVHIANR
ncbi:MAG: dihydrolipoyl dehydrogenase [Sandaracinaceae bacterium]|nr:dihydrolipoyl dehydrogenase [Sandaracinaceae bacterium]